MEDVTLALCVGWLYFLARKLRGATGSNDIRAAIYVDNDGCFYDSSKRLDGGADDLDYSKCND